jgi:hypothetical protein
MCQNASPVYAGAWAPDNQAILYANNNLLTVKPLAANAKATTWTAHDGVILSADWVVLCSLYKVMQAQVSESCEGMDRFWRRGPEV